MIAGEPKDCDVNSDVGKQAPVQVGWRVLVRRFLKVEVSRNGEYERGVRLLLRCNRS